MAFYIHYREKELLIDYIAEKDEGRCVRFDGAEFGTYR